MLNRKLVAAVTVCVAIGEAPTLAADAAAGRELALRWCAVCHLVAADQERAPTIAPPFAAIGKRAGFDAAQLSKSMLAPHPQMPGRELSREQAADIAAYIGTLTK
jgi:mono/diheme cytochrome c family protein